MQNLNLLRLIREVRDGICYVVQKCIILLFCNLIKLQQARNIQHKAQKVKSLNIFFRHNRVRKIAIFYFVKKPRNMTLKLYLEIENSS